MTAMPLTTSFFATLTLRSAFELNTPRRFGFDNTSCLQYNPVTMKSTLRSPRLRARSALVQQTFIRHARQRRR